MPQREANRQPAGGEPDHREASVVRFEQYRIQLGFLRERFAVEMDDHCERDLGQCESQSSMRGHPRKLDHLSAFEVARCDLIQRRNLEDLSGRNEPVACAAPAQGAVGILKPTYKTSANTQHSEGFRGVGKSEAR